MAKYKGSVELISGITQANGQTFPLVNASAVQTDDNDKRLDKSLEEINKNFETVNANIEAVNTIAVSSEQPKKENVEMWVDPETEEEFFIPEIKDDEINSSDTWSSDKINAEIEKAKTSSSADKNAVTEMKASIDKTYGTISVMKESIENVNTSVQNTYEDFLSKSSEAVTSIQSEGKTQLNTITSSGSTQKAAVEKAGTDAVSSINTAKTTAVSSVTSEGDKQVKAVTSSGATAVSNITTAQNNSIKAVTDEGTKQKNAVTAAASTAKTEISTAQTDAVKAITTEGNKQLSSITSAATEISKINGVEISTDQPTNTKTAIWINPDVEENINIAEINDSTINTVDTWSSKKINDELITLKSQVAELTALLASDEEANTYLGGNE